LKRRWKLILNIITVVALGVLVVAIHKQLISTFNRLAEVNAWFLVLLVPIQALNYHAQTKLYQGLFGVLGDRLTYRFLYRVALELNFVNHVFPSGGVSGISYFGVRVKNAEITGGKATAVQLIKLVMLFLSFEVLLIAGLLFLALGNHVNNFVILVTSIITTLMVVGTFGFVMIIGSERRIHATFSFLAQVINKTLYFFLRRSPEIINMKRAERVFGDLHTNYKVIESSWRRLRGVFVWAFMANVTEVLSIYVVYLAFGQWVNPGAVILAYAVANFAGLVSVMPGGVGIYEALMTAVLVASGVPAATSLPVTVMYRVLSTLIQVPPGWFLYHNTLLAEPKPAAPAELAQGDVPLHKTSHGSGHHSGLDSDTSNPHQS